MPEGNKKKGGGYPGLRLMFGGLFSFHTLHTTRLMFRYLLEAQSVLVSPLSYLLEVVCRAHGPRRDTNRKATSEKQLFSRQTFLRTQLQSNFRVLL